MGVHSNIDFDKWPKQGAYLNEPCRVVFNYDTSHSLFGKIIRDDAEEPGRMIIQLDDGRIVLSTECQWQPLSLAVPSRRAV